MKKRRNILIAAAVAVYFLLLGLLVALESGSPDASITSLGEAIWYSIVTMTTVGYGDAFPVTVPGKIIGGLFLLLSAGALTALITFGVSWVTGAGLPKFRIRRAGNRPIYIFNHADSASLALSDNILAETPDALCLFGETGGISPSDRSRIGVELSPARLLEQLPKSGGRPTVVFTGEDAEAQLTRMGIPENANVVCQTGRIPETLRADLHFFDRNELCASMYWQHYPLTRQERKVLLIGFGQLGRELLEQALLTNIFSPVRVTEYHVFGDASAFLLDHPQLGTSVSIGSVSPDRDSLILHTDPWNADEALLLSADRIILCSDDEAENTALSRRMKTWFPVTGKLHLYCRCVLMDGLTVFGTDSEIFTPEAVLRSGLERMARQINENYRAACGGNAPRWEELSAFLRRSNMASANHLRTKLRYLLDDDSLTEFTQAQLRQAYDRFRELRTEQPDLCRRIEHDRWVRFHAMYNWRYAPKRDNSRRFHPLMVPFDDLTLADQAKDDYAWELISSLYS